MSYNTIPIDLDKEKLVYLLNKFNQKLLTREEAVELKPLIERIWKKALDDDNIELASKMSTMLIALNGYISGKVTLSDYVPISGSIDVRKISM